MWGTRMPGADPLLGRIEVFEARIGGGLAVRRTRGGYSLHLEFDGTPVARLRPTGQDDEVEVLWWSHHERWEPVGDFGSLVLPLDEALQYIADDPVGCFWP